MSTILVVDDDESIRVWLEREVTSAGHRALLAATGPEAVEIARPHRLGLALIDQRMPGGLDGVATLEALLPDHPGLVALLFTGFTLSELELDRALRAGFAGYLQKRGDEPAPVAERIAAELQRQAAAGGPAGPAGFIGTSAAIREVLAKVRTVAPLDVPVLVRGESGTGKEHIARMIHEQSRRAKGPFVPVNCSGVTPTLFEAEFFGHEKGAFTGAVGRRPGYFERAAGGTLFLDEVAELGVDLQAKLLRVIEDGEVPLVGGRRTVRVDVRAVAATNRDVERGMKDGSFREDLYYRLAGVTVAIPPVRERGGDLDLLVDHFFVRAKRELSKPDLQLSPEVCALLTHYHWPGNVREIEHRMREAALQAAGGVVRVRDMPALSQATAPGLTADDFALPPGLSLIEARRRVQASVEAAWIRRALLSNGGNLTAAAAALGIDPRTLYTLARRYRITGTDRSPWRPAGS